MQDLGITWSTNQNGAYDVYGRRYDTDGKPQGLEFKINPESSQHEYNSDVLSLNDGGFIVSWNAQYIDGADYEAYAQRYDAEGVKVGDSFKLNDYMGNNQQNARLEQLEDGQIAAVWQSNGQDGSGWGIYGKVLALDGSVKEGVASGTTVGQVNVDDSDFDDQHQFALVDDAGGRFMIDADTGVISVADPDLIDYSEDTSHDLSIQVTDSAGHTLTQTLSVDVTPSNRAPASMSLERVESEAFALHTFTTGGQVHPVITALDDGGFLSVWTTRNGSASTGGDGSYDSVKAQRFDADGQPAGNEFQINQSTYHNQQQPSVTTLTNGDVLVTWTSYQSGSNYRVYGRRFDGEGNALSSEFTVFEGAGTHQYETDVTALEDGGYLVSWQDNTLDGSDYGVFAQRFNGDDEGQGQFRVNSYTSSTQNWPDTAGLSDGGYVVVWQGRGADQTGNNGVYLRQYSANGETLLETAVSNTITSEQINAKVSALTDGGYVVSWSSNHDGYYDAYARIFNAHGEPEGDEFQLSTQAATQDYTYDVIGLDDGGFISTWYANGDGASNEVYARRYDSSGEAIGEAFKVNDYIGDNQYASQLEVLADGRVAAVWHSYKEDGSDWGVYGKLMSMEGLVKDSAAADTAVGKVKVDDPDLGDEHQFALVDDAGGRFTIDANTGVISVADPDLIDYYDTSAHELSVNVTDSAGHTLTQTLTVDVAPSNRAPASLSLGRIESEEVAVNQFTTGSQVDPVVTALDNGHFMTVWTNQNATASTGGDGNSYSVKARLFDADGQSVGNEFQVNANTSSVQQQPSVTTLSNGDVLVTWISHHPGAYRIYGRRFDEDGNALTGDFTLYEGSGSHQYQPEVTALADGGYLTTWYDNSQDGSSNGVYAQRFDADDQGMGQFRVNDYTTGAQDVPDATGLSDGGYVIVWDGRGSDQTGDDGVYLRQYSADGQMLADLTVSSSINGTQTNTT